MIRSLQLLDDLKIVTSHYCQVRDGAEVWRVVLSFISDIPDKNRLIKEYYVWVTGDYLNQKEQTVPNIDLAVHFALRLAQKRFVESGNQVPIENGISCSLEDGELIVNPRSFVHPVEKLQ